MCRGIDILLNERSLDTKFTQKPHPLPHSCSKTTHTHNSTSFTQPVSSHSYGRGAGLLGQFSVGVTAMVHILSKCLMAGVLLVAFLPLLCSMCSEGSQRRCHKSKQNPIETHPSSFTRLISPNPKYIIITSVPGLPYTL